MRLRSWWSMDNEQYEMILMGKKQQYERTPMEKKLFAVVAGTRLSGKTTLVGTLPGKTLMLQAEVLESGSRSAVALAKKLDRDLTVHTFASLTELKSQVHELRSDKLYDNLYIDGFSALTEMKSREGDYVALSKKNAWDGYRLLGEQVTDIVLALKGLSYPQVEKPKNVFLTCALRVNEKGGVVDVKLEAVGQMAVSDLTKLGECVFTLVLEPAEENKLKRVLLTNNKGLWPARIDGILDEDNPGELAPDLSKVLQLIGV